MTKKAATTKVRGRSVMATPGQQPEEEAAPAAKEDGHTSKEDGSPSKGNLAQALRHGDKPKSGKRKLPAALIAHQFKKRGA